MVEGQGSTTEGKPKTFEKDVWLFFFFFPVLNCKYKVFNLSLQELKMKKILPKEKRKDVPDGNLEKIHRKEGAGKKRTQAWDSRRTCRVLRRALNEKSFLQVWGPRVQPAEG